MTFTVTAWTFNLTVVIESEGVWTVTGWGVNSVTGTFFTIVGSVTSVTDLVTDLTFGVFVDFPHVFWTVTSWWLES